MDKSINIGCEDRLAMDERHIYPRYMAIRLADETLTTDWFVNFPETDSDTGPFAFPFIYPEYAQLLPNMAFAYMLMEDEKYLAMKERLLTMARYQPNGCSSPEGFPSGEKFCTKITLQPLYPTSFRRGSHGEGLPFLPLIDSCRGYMSVAISLDKNDT